MGGGRLRSRRVTRAAAAARALAVAVGAVLSSVGSVARATNGTWINTAGGNWSAGTNWQGGTIAGGADSTADFSTLNITSNVSVHLDGSRTVGNLKFGDTTSSNA